MEDKERHFQNSLKSLVSYDRKLELGTQSIMINRVFKLLQPQKVTIQYQTTFENNAMYSYRMYSVKISLPLVLLYGQLYRLSALIQ